LKYFQEEESVILTDYNSFNITETLECGQCFRYEKIGENKYHIIAFSKSLHIHQTKEKTVFSKTSIKEFKEIWIPYFDLNNNYQNIKETLSSNDTIMRDAVQFAPGIRILRQDPWECLISFIISQNNNIPRIRKLIDVLSRTYGNPISENSYAFPTPEQLSKASIEDLFNCKTGFRAKYIHAATAMIHSGLLNLNALHQMDITEAREQLMSIKGVGRKIADCVLLFAYSKAEVFPTDVWVKRVVQHFSFNKQDTPIAQIHKLAETQFGSFAGFAQQYLFVYARNFL
jgi:N-glycosylase/DNA lyase